MSEMTCLAALYSRSFKAAKILHRASYCQAECEKLPLAINKYLLTSDNPGMNNCNDIGIN